MIIGLDTETDNTKNGSLVCLAYCDMNSNYSGKIVKDWNNFFQLLRREKGFVHKIYTHNLTFDIKPLLYRIIKHENNFKWSKSAWTSEDYDNYNQGENTHESNWSIRYQLRAIEKKKANGKKYSKTLKVFNERTYYIIQKNGSVVYLELRYLNKIWKFYDTWKLNQASLDKIAKTYNLETQKLVGNWDYEKSYTYEQVINTKELKDYVLHDIYILRDWYNKDKNLFRYMSIASMAFSKLKQDLDLTEVIDINEEDAFKLRSAIRGGYVYVNPKYKEKIVDNIYHYDINSSYPNIMGNYSMPKGKGVHTKKVQKDKINIMFLTLTGRLRENRFPIIKGKAGFNDANYYNRVKDFNYSCTYEEYLYLQKNYIFSSLKINDIIAYDKTDIFKDYIKEIYILKQNAKDETERAQYKAILNHITGKFSQYIDSAHTEIEISMHDTVSFKEISDNSKVKYIYSPINICITSYARIYLWNQIDKIGYNNFIYCDTDSIFSIKEFDKEDQDVSELGKWKLEHYNFKGKFLNAKRYIGYGLEYNKTEQKWLPKGVQVMAGYNGKKWTPKAYNDYSTFNDFKFGSEANDKRGKINRPEGLIEISNKLPFNLSDKQSIEEIEQRIFGDGIILI